MSVTPILEQYLLRSFVSFNTGSNHYCGKSDSYLDARVSKLLANNEASPIKTIEEATLIKHNIMQAFDCDNDQESIGTDQQGLVIIKKPQCETQEIVVPPDFMINCRYIRGYAEVPFPKKYNENIIIVINSDKGMKILDMKNFIVLASSSFKPRQQISGMGGDANQYAIHFRLDKMSKIPLAFVYQSSNGMALEFSLDPFIDALNAGKPLSSIADDYANKDAELQPVEIGDKLEDMCSLNGDLYFLSKEGSLVNHTKNKKGHLKNPTGGNVFNLIKGKDNSLAVVSYSSQTQSASVFLVDATNLNLLDMKESNTKNSGVRTLEFFSLSNRMRGVMLVFREYYISFFIVGKKRLFTLLNCERATHDYQYSAVKLSCSQDILRVKVLNVARSSEILCIKY